MLKKCIAVLVTLMLVTLCGVTTYAGGIDIEIDPTNPPLNLGTKAESERLTQEEAMLVIQKERALAQRKSINSRTLAAASAYNVNLSVTRQIVGYYCGPASANMVISSF